MHKKEPFREAFKPVRGMMRVAGLKDDPRYHGGRVARPRTDGFVIRPDPVMLIVRIIFWAGAVFASLASLDDFSFAIFVIMAVILDAIFAIPKFLFERTAVLPEGIERTLLFMEQFFPWENIHGVTRDALGVSFRSKRPWGIWMDDYNFLVSWLYYSQGSVDRIAGLFPELVEKHHAAPPRKLDHDELIDLKHGATG